MLATIIAISSLSITYEDTFAQTGITINTISQITNTGTLELDGPWAITSFKIGTSTYLAVASFDDGSVQILDVSTPNTITQVSQITDTDAGTLELDGARGITSFKIGSSTYLAVASVTDDGVQILSVNSAGTVSAVSQITDTDAGTLELDGAIGITSFKIGSSTYLAVASVTDDGVQILSVNSAGTVSAVSQITDTDAGTLELDGARGITSFKIGSSTYLAVASVTDNGVQILSVNSAGAVSAVSQITDAGALELDGATGITSFKIGSTTYLAVASVTDDGVQILRVDSAGAVSAVSQITDTDAGTLELDGARGITSFKIGSSTYLAVASVTDDGVQILSVNSAGTVSAVSQITDTDAGTLELDGAIGITSFKIGSSTYLAVASFIDDGVQMLELIPTTTNPTQNQPPTANAGRDKSAAPGSTVTLNGSGTDPDGDTLDYTWEQTSGTPVNIDNRNSARTTFTAPPDPTELVFTLTVDDRTDSATDDITITIKERIQTRNIKEMSDTLISATITAPNEITMIYNEELSTFINSYLNFTISDEDKPRSITGINGSPAIETGETVRINGKQVKAYSTTLTFDGEPVPAGSTGTMYMQHADHYLALIQVSNGQD